VETRETVIICFLMQDNKWVRLLAYVTGLVNQRLLLQCEYLTAENRILRSQLPGRLRLSDAQRSTLAEIGKRLGRKQLAEVAFVAKPATILAWYRRLIAQKFDGSRRRCYPGRPRVDRTVETLVIRMARENSGWGYDRIVGALANLGHKVSDQTVGNILKRHGMAPAPKRSQNTTWKDFIAAHMAVLAGTDFFTVEVVTWRGLVTYYVLFFLHLETRRVTLAGITRHPTEAWMAQMARNAVDEPSGCLKNCRYVLHDRDTKFCAAFDDILRSGGIESLTLPAQSPNLKESERFCGTLGALGERGVLVQVDSVWRRLTASCTAGVREAFPRREKSSGQRQHSLVSDHRSSRARPRRPCTLQRASGRHAEILPSRGRMNI
jgi:putative transposase